MPHPRPPRRRPRRARPGGRRARGPSRSPRAGAASRRAARGTPRPRRRPRARSGRCRCRSSAATIAPAPSRSSTAKRSGDPGSRDAELAARDHRDARARAALLLHGEHRGGDGGRVAQAAEHARRRRSRRSLGDGGAVDRDGVGPRRPARTSSPRSTAWITVDENRSTSTTTTMSRRARAGRARRRPTRGGPGTTTDRRDAAARASLQRRRAPRRPRSRHRSARCETGACASCSSSSSTATRMPRGGPCTHRARWPSSTDRCSTSRRSMPKGLPTTWSPGDDIPVQLSAHRRGADGPPAHPRERALRRRARTDGCGSSATAASR